MPLQTIVKTGSRLGETPNLDDYKKDGFESNVKPLAIRESCNYRLERHLLEVV